MFKNGFRQQKEHSRTDEAGTSGPVRSGVVDSRRRMALVLELVEVGVSGLGTLLDGLEIAIQAGRVSSERSPEPIGQGDVVDGSPDVEDPASMLTTMCRWTWW